jgi:hypothetical protein
VKILKKRASVAVTLVLITAMAASLLASTQNVKAVTTMPTYSFITARPNPVGVGQSVLVTAFLDRYPPAGPNYVPPYYVLWDFTVTITDPDGTVQTKKLTSDPIGGATFSFTPDKVGTWTLKNHFEGATVEAVNTTYSPSDSTSYSLTVQEEQIQPWPGAPLPTEYWQRPIEAENREWSSIAGNWLNIPQAIEGSGISYTTGGGRINPYSTALGSPHIMWTKPLMLGGVVGGVSDIGFYTGDSYERKFYDKIVIDGVLYQNIPLANNMVGGGFMAIDLRTGKELYRTENGTINFGQLLQFEGNDQHGIIPYLWNTNLQMFDPNTGKWLLDFANITSGTRVLDEKGNLLTYTLNYPQRTLTLWNATQALLYEVPTTGYLVPGQAWRPVYGRTYDWNSGVMWNVTIPDLTAYGVNYGVTGSTGPVIRTFGLDDGVVIARFQGASNETYPIGYIVDVGYSMIDGHQLWVKLRTATGEIETGLNTPTGGIFAGPGVYIVWKEETMQFHIYNDLTGELQCKTDPYTSAWGLYHMTMSENPGQVAYGKFYTISYDGKLHCYDFETGKLLWTALGYSSGTETPYGVWPTVMMVIADGKVYVTNGEHSPNQPLYRGYRLYCVDAESGELLWSVLNYAQSPIIADGYLVAFNGYDQQEYCFGKGPSATTVLIQDDVVTHGDKVVIKGTVTDISPGTEAYTQTARFPHGVPAIADESMGPWMEYLYEQKPMPTNATGVPVTLDVIDANGNYRNIGNTTSDMNGFYSFEWQPDIPGKYTVIATFAGSESYYASYSETAFTVTEAPPATPTPAAAPDTTMTIIGTGIGTGIAIIIAIAVAVLMLRKRP